MLLSSQVLSYMVLDTTYNLLVQCSDHVHRDVKRQVVVDAHIDSVGPWC